MIGDMTGRAALVTGAASGLGRGTALALAKAGADVCIVDISAAGLEETAGEVRALGRVVEACTTDLSVPENCRTAVAAAVARFGRLDALCNVAGLIYFHNTPEMPEADWARTIAVNLSAPFFLSQAAIPHLLEKEGAIVNVASSAAFVGEAYAAAYCASKAGLVQMTKAMAMEYTHKPIRINAVAPGGMVTNIAANLRMPEGADMALIRRFSGMRGTVEVEDVADLVAYLASPAARGYHGSCISIDAGVTARMIRTGFVGLGSQGGPMARRMVEGGYPLTLWARRPDALAAYADTQAEIATSIAALGEACDHVGICVLDDAGVRQVCAELIPAMRPGASVAIHATVHPETCVDLAQQAQARGLSLIDAPVSGGGPAAAAGTLTVMVGGEAAAVAAARPIFETFAGLIVHLGGVGAGQMAKLVNNSLMAANMAVAHHALASGEALGIDRKALADLIKASSGRSFGFEVYARLPAPGSFAHGAKLLAKDIGLLGALLPGNPAFAALSDVARPFVDLVEQEAGQA